MHQVRYFLAVAKTRNFTQAAELCHVAQPSLSRAIKKLEEELGGDLFRRERNLSHLTEIGRQMVPLLTQCYESALSAKGLAASFKKGGSPPLHLALSHTVNMQLLVQPRTEVVKAFPGLELKFHRGTAGEVADRLKSGDAELGLACPLGDPWDRFEAWVLYTEPYRLVVHKDHALARRKAVELKELAGLRLLSRPYGEQEGALAEMLVKHGIQHDTGDTIGSDQDMMDLLGANVSAGILPRSACSSDTLRSIAIEGLEVTRPVALYAVAGRQRSPAASLLVKLLRAANWSHYSA